MHLSEAARRGAREEGTEQMADKKIEPKQPSKDEPAAGIRDTEKTSARRWSMRRWTTRRWTTRRWNSKKY